MHIRILCTINVKREHRRDRQRGRGDEGWENFVSILCWRQGGPALTYRLFSKNQVRARPCQGVVPEECTGEGEGEEDVVSLLSSQGGDPTSFIQLAVLEAAARFGNRLTEG